MPRLRTVYMYPYAGFPETPWGEARGANGPFSTEILDLDAAARSSRRVCESISHQLDQSEIHSRRAQYQVGLKVGPSSRTVRVRPSPSTSKYGFLGVGEVGGGRRIRELDRIFMSVVWPVEVDSRPGPPGTGFRRDRRRRLLALVGRRRGTRSNDPADYETSTGLDVALQHFQGRPRRALRWPSRSGCRKWIGFHVARVGNRPRHRRRHRCRRSGLKVGPSLSRTTS